MFEIPVNIGKVVSISVHGRKVFYLTMTDGTKQEFGDVNDLLKVLVEEIGDYRKARKFINQLENKVWMHGLKEHERELGHQASRELLKIARELVSGILDEPQYDTGFFEQSPFPPTNEYRNPPTELDPASEVTHCQCSGNPV